jgi:hypothetical protein
MLISFLLSLREHALFGGSGELRIVRRETFFSRLERRFMRLLRVLRGEEGIGAAPRRPAAHRSRPAHQRSRYE